MNKLERAGCPPWGLSGGEAGSSPTGEILRASGERQPLRKGMLAVAPGDVAHIVSGGGGGYGPPHERKASQVLADVVDGYISREMAAERYGVVISEDLAIDEAATARRRSGGDQRE
jgi:N-methylhydantoinase B